VGPLKRQWQEPESLPQPGPSPPNLALQESCQQKMLETVHLDSQLLPFCHFCFVWHLSLSLSHTHTHTHTHTHPFFLLNHQKVHHDTPPLNTLSVSSKNKDCLLHNHPIHHHAQKSDPASTRDLVPGPQSSVLSVPRVSVRALLSCQGRGSIHLVTMSSQSPLTWNRPCSCHCFHCMYV